MTETLMSDIQLLLQTKGFLVLWPVKAMNQTMHVQSVRQGFRGSSPNKLRYQIQILQDPCMRIYI
jgi:hypothetical protein